MVGGGVACDWCFGIGFALGQQTQRAHTLAEAEAEEINSVWAGVRVCECVRQRSNERARGAVVIGQTRRGTAWGVDRQ